MKIMKSPKTLMLFFVVAIALCGTMWVIGHKQLGASSEFFNLGEKMYNNTQVSDADTVVMKVNEAAISKQEYLNQKVMLEMAQQSEVDDETVKNKLVEFTVLWQEAKSRGIAATEEEAVNYANEMKQLFEQAQDNPKSAPDNASLILEYIQGTGQTVDEFFAGSVHGYQKMLSIGNLRKSISKEVLDDVSEDTPQDEITALVDGRFEDLKKELISEAHIEMVAK